MVDCVALAETCRFAQVSGGMGSGRRLNREERELLVAAAESGSFYLFSADRAPWTWLRAGRLGFFDLHDTSVASRYNEAFRSLCKRAYIEHRAGIVFTLSESGGRAARELARESGLPCRRAV